jgi:hypothetical protein
MTAMLKLREDAYWSGSASGVYILTQQGEVSLTGRSVQSWLERLAPLLDGRHSLADLTAALPEDRRAFVARLLGALIERGVVRSLQSPAPAGYLPPPLTLAEQAEHESQLRFVGYFQDEAPAAFGRYRALSTVIIGSGPVVTAAARAARRSGLRDVQVLPLAEPGAQPLGADVRPPGEADALGEVIAGADLVVHVCGPAGVERAARIDALCARLGTLAAQAVMVDGEVWLSLPERPDPAAAMHLGWTSGWARRTALSGSTSGPGPVMELSSTVSRVLANHLLHSIFRIVTGSAPSSAPSLTRFTPDAVDFTTHRYLRHPFGAPAPAPDGQGFADRLAALVAGPALSTDEFSRRAIDASDARCGIFAEITESDFAQLPVHVATTVVADPVGLIAPSAPRPVVFGSGPDFASARYRVALRALATYSSLMIDPRRVLRADRRPWTRPDADPHEALSGLRANPGQGYLHGVDPADGDVRAIPVGEVFPALLGAGAGYRAPCGVVAAYSWAEAVLEGLIAHCRRLTMARIGTHDALFPQIELSGPLLDDLARYATAMLAAVGVSAEAYDVTSVLGVPTVACALEGRVVAYGCAPSLSAALSRGLENVLLAYQARLNGQPDYAPPEVPDLPGHLRGAPAPAPPLGSLCDAPALRHRLAELGLTATAVPLDHDQEVHRIMPYVVHVVVSSAGR